jgi:iron complex outermembrane recepter protein
MNRTPSEARRLALALALAAGLTTAVHAEAPAKTEAAGQLEDIVITATKRESRLQDTPISVTAVTGEDIQERGLADFTALAMSVPGLSMRSSGPGQTEFEMRGMTSAGGNSSTVGFYFDDTPLTAPASAQNGKVVIDPNLYDLNHVEVLRGPQGTLYGAGSMGGTVKIVPNAPNPAGFDASAEATFGDTKGGGFNHGENAMLNLPLGSTAALRIVASESHDSGWIDRLVIADGQFPPPNGAARGNVLAAPVAIDQSKANDTELNAVRATLLWTPTDRLTVSPTFMYQRIFQNGLSLIDSNPGVNATFQPFDEPEPFSDQFALGSLSLKYRFDGFELVSVSSDWTRDEHLRQAGSEEVAIAINAPYYVAQGGFGPLVPTPLEDDKSKQFSEEVRLTSTGDGSLKWLVGWFYADFRSDWDLFLTQPGALAGTGTTDAFTFYQPTKIIQNAFFGELSYQVTSKLKATVGLRHFYYNSSIVSTVAGYLSSSGGSNFVSASTATRDQGLNPKFDLSYQVDKDLLLYATVAKGFRPGGGNQPIPTTGSLGAQCEAELQQKFGTTGVVSAPLSFAPDRVWSYELGEKWRTAGGRVTVNGAAYFEKWNGVQQNIPLGCGFPYTDNAGYAQIHGFEAEISALVAPGLILSANAGYAHAVFVGDNLETGITSGTAVQDVPEWTSSAGATYRHPLGRDLSLLVRLDNNYVSGHYDATAQINHLPSYDLTNLRAGVEGERWSATLFAKNLFNQRAEFSDVPAINISVPQFNRIAVSQPLTIGVDLNYRFGK